MLLIGMFDSPYVRRVAISMKTLGLPFEHANWSIGKDLDRIAAHNPLGQVPVLVLDGGEAVLDSAMILDYLDHVVGPARALVPGDGDARRRVNRWIALSTGVADKARIVGFELYFRPADKRHPPLVDRVRAQMIAACATLDAACAARRNETWLEGDAITQADITLVAAITYARELAGLELPAALHARCAQLAELPAVRATYVPFDPPVVAS